MITTKYNFRQWCHRKYPDVTLTSVYNIPAYTLDKALDPIDMFEYNIQQLPSGQYIVFIGMTPQQSMEWMAEIRKKGLPKRESWSRATAPTTFTCFESWCKRHDLQWINRTFAPRKTPLELFQTDKCIQPLVRKTWYMYEFYEATVDEAVPTDIETVFASSPHVSINNKDGTRILIVLVKASESKYVSKRSKFVQQFQTMQPIYEQLIKALSQYEIAPTDEHLTEARSLCEQYMGIQFERNGRVNTERMVEAWQNGTLGFFVRDVNNLLPIEDEDF